MGLWFAVGIILISSGVIYIAGEQFAKSSSAIGDYLRLPRSVKAATFDAVASSLPELFVALFSVIAFRTFEVGIGTIAGSALFNLLIIPGLCVFVAPVAFKVSKKTISRDALFYLISVFALVTLLLYFQYWGIAIAVFLLAIYLWYSTNIFRHAKKYRKNSKKKKEVNMLRELALFFLTIAVIGFSAYMLTEASIGLSTALGVPAIIIAFTVTAAATSVPDTVISLANARRGDITDATSNVFGSNIFDILVGLGLPLLIYSLMNGAVQITFANFEIILGLLGATIIVLYFFAEEHVLRKRQGAFLLALYAFFVTYIVLLSAGIFSSPVV